jgi:hypothetical protein
MTTASDPVPPTSRPPRDGDPNAHTATPQPDEETTLLRWEGLPTASKPCRILRV